MIFTVIYFLLLIVTYTFINNISFLKLLVCLILVVFLLIFFRNSPITFIFKNDVIANDVIFKKPVHLQKPRPYSKTPVFYQNPGLLSKPRSFIKTPVFYQNPDLLSKPRSFIKTPSFFKNPVLLPKTRVFKKPRPFSETPVFYQKPVFSENPGFSRALKYAKTRASHYHTFIIYIYFKMSEHYRREFDVWLEAFKQGDLFEEIVEGFDHDWSLIYKELHRIFKRNVWNHVLEQRARERDHDRIIPSTQTFHGRMPVKSTENIAKSTEDRFLQRPAERRTDHISLF